MNYLLFDDQCRIDLLPLTYTRPVAAIRIGIMTIAEKWEFLLRTKVSYYTQAYLQKKFPAKIAERNILINGSVCPDKELIAAINSLTEGEVLVKGTVLLALQLAESAIGHFDGLSIPKGLNMVEYKGKLLKIYFPEDIFKYNGVALEADYALLTAGRKSMVPDSSNIILGDKVFIEEGAQVQASVLNSTSGPIYIGKYAEVMEGSLVRGPFALGEHSTLKMGAKIYGPTTIGPHSKIGGEVNNSVIFGYTNKAHDGFLGNAVIGEWCNLGADSNNSNLKNNYAEVRLWSYRSNSFRKTGMQFCGLIMGDHSKCGINTMFNTGTVVGVSANVFGSGFPRNFIPDFAWGGAAGFETYGLSKANEVAEKVFERRGLSFDETELAILKEVFDQTEQHRRF